MSALDENGSARIGAAIHSTRAVDPDSAAAVTRWARERERPLHAHVSEQPAENEACLAAYGRTPTRLLDEAGALAANFTAVHATHLDDADVSLLVPPGRAAACVRPPSAIWPTGSAGCADSLTQERRSRSAATRMR